MPTVDEVLKEQAKEISEEQGKPFTPLIFLADKKCSSPNKAKAKKMEPNKRKRRKK